jgi:hypothetical protein
VGRGADGGGIELPFDAHPGGAKGGALQKEAAFEFERQVDDDGDRDHVADLGGRLAGDFFASNGSVEANDHRDEHGRNNGLGVCDPLRIAQDENAAVSRVRDDDRFDGTKRRAGSGIHHGELSGPLLMYDLRPAGRRKLLAWQRSGD